MEALALAYFFILASQWSNYFMQHQHSPEEHE